MIWPASCFLGFSVCCCLQAPARVSPQFLFHQGRWMRRRAGPSRRDFGRFLTGSACGAGGCRQAAAPNKGAGQEEANCIPAELRLAFFRTHKKRLRLQGQAAFLECGGPGFRRRGHGRREFPGLCPPLCFGKYEKIFKYGTKHSPISPAGPSSHGHQ